MDFEFSSDQRALGELARRFLVNRSPSSAVRAVLNGPEPFDRELWHGFAELGFTGVTISEEHGGVGAGYLELCVIAEELGRSLAPIPFSSSIYLCAELLKAGASPTQQQQHLPKLAVGEQIGTFAQTDAPERPCSVINGKLSGEKALVADGDVANFAVVTAQGPDQELGLFIVDLQAPGVRRARLETIDPTRNHARVTFDNSPCEPLGERSGAAILHRALNTAAVLFAFEQVGGADRALEMARDYAKERMAFGRAIGSFQAIKHMLANMYVAAALARSNAYFAAWALSADDAQLPLAAALARVSASHAYMQCARDSIQVHGGIGFTWEHDAHLHYRRANLLALNLGPISAWERAVVDRLALAPLGDAA